MGQPNWFIDILRILFRFIDYVAYWLVDEVYQLFIMISETGVFSPEAIGGFATRIYALLGIFMLFKVSFSLITYIINPDSFVDKNKGIGKLLTNFFVALIGIVAVPYVFQAAYGLQAIVLKENVIGNLIMGMNASAVDSGESDSYIEQGGKMMAFTTLSAFMRLNPDLVGPDCSKNPVLTLRDEQNNVIMDGDYPAVKINEACLGTSAMGAKVGNGITVAELLEQAYRENDVYLFTTTDLVELKAYNGNTKYYIMDYTILISTVAGGFLAWILLMFCIDIATRSVKLGFLQLVAPIPIISYVDPKGQDTFQKWLKECGKTYADLFIRLVAVYFVIFIISELTRGGFYNIVSEKVQQVDSFESLLVRILIIFGALMFAKQLPDLISNILGVKLSGNGFTLNPMNKLQQVPLAGAAATNLLGRTSGAIEAMRHDQTGNRWRAAASGWFAAGDALHGKVPLMGAKAGASTVRSWHTGREAGHEVATGSKLRAHSRVNDLFRRDGEARIDDLKKNYRAPLQQELSDIGLQKQEVANSYNRLNEQLQKATSDAEKDAIRRKMQQAQTRYNELATREAKISGDIGTINDQIKDLERAYSIDKSPVNKINEVKGKVDTNTHAVRDGAYGSTLEPIDYSISSPESPSNSTGQTSGTHRVTVRRKDGSSASSNTQSSGAHKVTVRRKEQ